MKKIMLLVLLLVGMFGICFADVTATASTTWNNAWAWNWDIDLSHGSVKCVSEGFTHMYESAFQHEGQGFIDGLELTGSFHNPKDMLANFYIGHFLFATYNLYDEGDKDVSYLTYGGKHNDADPKYLVGFNGSKVHECIGYEIGNDAIYGTHFWNDFYIAPFVQYGISIFNLQMEWRLRYPQCDAVCKVGSAIWF
jgi:hypothetical protein